MPTVLHDKILRNSRHLSFASSQRFPLCHRGAHKRGELGWTESFQTSKGARRLNRRHFATPKMVSPPNDVSETSAEIPYGWRIFWLVEANFPRSTTRTREETRSMRREMWAVFSSYRGSDCHWFDINVSPPNLLIHLDIASLWSRGQCVPRNVADQVSPLSDQLLGSKCSEAQNFLQASQYVWKQSQKL